MELDFETVELELALPWATSRTVEPGGLRTSPVVHVCLRDEDGMTGHGEAAPISRYGESVESASSFLARLETNALSGESFEASVEYLAKVGSGEMAARCAVESALLDLTARRKAVPVWKLLGLPQLIPKPVSYTIGIGSPERVREQAARARDFQILKLKLGGPHDRAALAALREVAPDKRVRIDANEGWSTREEALQMIEWLATDPLIELVEQPLSAKLPDRDHMWLYERSPLPLFADESCHRSQDIARLAGYFHGFNVKLMKTGGLMEATRCLQTARARQRQTMLGCMIESSLGIATAFQLAGLADLLDLDSHTLLARDPFGGLLMESGVLRLAKGENCPGLGVWPEKDQVHGRIRR